jgi:molybdopterin-guanine dinucleotide biosynthesis protein A
MSERVSCVGVVLAGGKSARMGTEKAALRIGGEPLLARILGRLRLALPAVYVVGPPRLRTLAPEFPVLPDDTPDAGPLGGLATALAHLSELSNLSELTYSHAFVVGCDMPFVEPKLVTAMAHYSLSHPDADVVALRTSRGLEPLHAVYANSCAQAAHEQVSSGKARALGALLARLRVKELPASEVAYYDPAGRSAFNVNTPEAWREALAIYAQESGALPSHE